MFTTTEIVKGVHLHIRPTTQFKTISVSLKAKQKLTNESASHRAVLANVLQHSSKEFPTQQSFRQRFEDLYGAIFYVDASKRGYEHVLTAHLETVNDAYLNDKGVFKSAIETFSHAIFQPNFQNGNWTEKLVNREKQSINERIESVLDDKTRYAQQRLTEIIRPDHPASISSNGTTQEVEKITVDSLREAYDSFIHEDLIDIYVVGDVNEQEMISLFKTAFPYNDRSSNPTESKEFKVQSQNDKITLEKKQMNQGKLHIAYRSPITFGDEKLPTMQIANGILGGFSHSKLFTNVREKESMAYYVSSQFASHYGLMYILAGIEGDLREKAVQLIQQQINEMSEGAITDLEMEQTKAMLTNHLIEAMDSSRAQIDIYDQYKEAYPSFNVDQWIEQIQSIQKQDIQSMAKEWELEHIYFLSGQEVVKS